jgi:hypothetical protein
MQNYVQKIDANIYEDQYEKEIQPLEDDQEPKIIII